MGEWVDDGWINKYLVAGMRFGEGSVFKYSPQLFHYMKKHWVNTVNATGECQYYIPWERSTVNH